MRHVLVLSTVLALLCLPAFGASKAPKELVASVAFNDSLGTEARSLSGNLNLLFPLTSILSIGPVGQYDYVRFQKTEVVLEPVSVIETESDHPPVSTATHVKQTTDTLGIWSVGGRAAVYSRKSHNGFYGAAEVIVPQKDAQGYLVTPEVGIQWTFGGALARVAYRRPYNYSQGEAYDLDSQEVTFGFGARF